jgi:hypothetical protein
MKTSLIIYRPVEAVWNYLTSAENWLDWWGGALEEVVPAWEEGAILRWSQGEPTRLSPFKDRQQFGLQGKWMETVFRLADAPGDSTRLEVEIQPRGGASFPDGGKAHIEDIATAIDRLKRLLEGTPMPDSPPVVEPQLLAQAQPDGTPRLRLGTYLALMAMTIAIGFVLSLIPCLVVNSLVAGSLSAWLWIRRERPPARLCMRRGLLAGMLAGLGSSLIGSLFFLWDIGEGDFTRILMAVAAALAMFLLPAALSGLLTGLVLSRRKVSQAAASVASPSEPGVTIEPVAAPSLPTLSRGIVESRMQTSASQGLAQLTALPKAGTTRQVVAQIMSGEAFAYAVQVVLDSLPDCLAEKSPRSAVDQFPGVLVAVTVFPAWTAEQVRALLPHGYVKLVQELVAPFQEEAASTHVAHWAFASDGSLVSVYLTVIPNPESDKDAPALIARELLTAQERADLGV